VADKPYNEENIQRALDAFEQEVTNAPEALLASVRLLVKSLARFRNDAAALRESLGEEATREFATQEMNELVYDIQDSVPVAVRLFNSMMRDKDSPRGPVGE